MKPKRVNWKWIMDQRKRGFMNSVSGYTTFMDGLMAIKQKKAEEERHERMVKADET